VVDDELLSPLADDVLLSAVTDDVFFAALADKVAGGGAGSRDFQLAC
jgi:hypothetical protein